MDPTRWERINRLFEACLDQDPAAGDQFLRRECGEDESLLAEVRSLLNHSGAANLWAQAAVDDAVAILGAGYPGLVPDEPFGQYRAIRAIGGGGMGLVFEGRRTDEQVQMRVAIKVVHPGLETSWILHRFRTERQILADLEHPNIARLFDAGITPSGRPYLVMEYVEGQAVTHYCHERRLAVRERVTIFLAICAAVDHAHRRLVVHCDLKPGNILVTPEGTPKLLDFGIARLLAPEGESSQTVTALALGLLTPAYASPEQLSGEPITTASDVYSLGVVLYEILAARRPYETKGMSPREVLHIANSGPPAPPSAIAGHCAGQLRGDLDKIVGKALARDPSERYPTVAALAQDLRHHLDGKPVSAVAPRFRYRLRKFASRHRAGVAASTLAVLSLVAGTAVSTVQARRAERRFDQVRSLARVFLFDFQDAIESLPGSTRARELVVRTGLRYLEDLEKDAPRDPALLREIGFAYSRLAQIQSRLSSSDLSSARKSADKAVRILQPLVASGNPTHPELGRTLNQAYDMLGAMSLQSGDTTQAIAYYEKALALMKGLLAARPNDPALLHDASDQTLMLAQTLHGQGRIEEALDRGREANRTLTTLAALDPKPAVRDMLAASHTVLANAFIRAGRFEEAVQHDLQGVAIREARLSEDPDNAKTMRQLLIAYGGVGDDYTDPLAPRADPAAALPYYRKMLSLAERLRVIDAADRRAQTDVVHALSRVGGVLAESQRSRPEALSLLARARGLSNTLLKADPAQFGLRLRAARVEEQIALLHLRMGRYPAAREAAEASLRHTALLVARDPLHTGALRQRLMTGRTFLIALAASGAPSETVEFANRLQAWTDATRASSDRATLLQLPAVLGTVAQAYKALHGRFPRPEYHSASCRYASAAVTQWQAIGASGAAAADSVGQAALLLATCGRP